MANAGNLNVTLTSNQATFTATMQGAAGSVNKLTETVNGSKTHFEKFNSHMFVSRHAIGTFAAISDSAVGPLSHLVHAFMLFPGVAGLAAGAMLLIKETFDHVSESTAKASEKIKEHYEVLRKIREFADEKRTTPLDEHIRTLEKHMADIHQQQEEMSSRWGRLKTAATSIIFPHEIEDAKARWQQLTREQKENQANMDLLKKKLDRGETGEKEGGAVIAGNMGEVGQLGVFLAEHDIGAQQVQLLSQIAQNTAKGAQQIFPLPRNEDF